MFIVQSGFSEYTEHTFSDFQLKGNTIKITDPICGFINIGTDLIICFNEPDHQDNLGIYVKMKVFPKVEIVDYFKRDFTLGLYDRKRVLMEVEKKMFYVWESLSGSSLWTVSMVEFDQNGYPIKSTNVARIDEVFTDCGDISSACGDESEISIVPEQLSYLYLNTYNSVGDDFCYLYDFEKKEVVLKHEIRSEDEKVEIYCHASFKKGGELCFACGGNKQRVYLFNSRDKKYFKRIQVPKEVPNLLAGEQFVSLHCFNNEYLVGLGNKGGIYLLHTESDYIASVKTEEIHANSVVYLRDKKRINIAANSGTIIQVFEIEGVQIVDKQGSLSLQDMKERIEFMLSSMDMYFKKEEEDLATIEIKVGNICVEKVHRILFLL